MEPTPRSARVLPTLALLLNAVPVALCLILAAFSLNGNWAFLILALITYLVSQCLCGVASLTLGILCICKKWGRVRAIIAVSLSSLLLLVTLDMLFSYLIRGL